MALSVNMVMAFDTCYSYSSWITYFLLFPILNQSGTNFFTRQSLLHMQDRLRRPAKGGILMLWILWPVFMFKEPERSQNHFVWEERCRKANVYITVVSWHIVILPQSSKPHFSSEATFCSLPAWITCFDLLSKWQNPSHAIDKIVVLTQGDIFKEASQAQPPLLTSLHMLMRKQIQIHWLWSSLQDPFLCVCHLLATLCKVAFISCHHCLPPGKGNLPGWGEISIPGEATTSLYCTKRVQTMAVQVQIFWSWLQILQCCIKWCLFLCWNMCFFSWYFFFIQ